MDENTVERITQALKSQASIAVIAELEGYSSPRSLTRAFKRATGKTCAQVARGLKEPQRGRPPVAERSESPQISCRLSSEEAAVLETLAEEKGVSRHTAAKQILSAYLSFFVLTDK